jgi:hypothetical protein
MTHAKLISVKEGVGVTRDNTSSMRSRILLELPLLPGLLSLLVLTSSIHVLRDFPILFLYVFQGLKQFTSTKRKKLSFSLNNIYFFYIKQK